MIPVSDQMVRVLLEAQEIELRQRRLRAGLLHNLPQRPSGMARLRSVVVALSGRRSHAAQPAYNELA